MPAAAAVEAEPLAARSVAASRWSSPLPALYFPLQPPHAGEQQRRLHPPPLQQQRGREQQQLHAWIRQQTRALDQQERALLQQQQWLEDVRQQIEQPTFFELLAQHKLLDGLLAAVEHVVTVLRDHFQQAELNHQRRQQLQLQQQRQRQQRYQQRQQHEEEDPDRKQQQRWTSRGQRQELNAVQQVGKGSRVQASTAGAAPTVAAGGRSGVSLGPAGAARTTEKRLRQQAEGSRAVSRRAASRVAAAAVRQAFCKWGETAARLRASLLQRLRGCATRDAVDTCCSKWRQVLLWLLQRWVLLYMLLIAAVELQSLLSAGASFPEAFYSIQRAQRPVLRLRELQHWQERHLDNLQQPPQLDQQQDGQQLQPQNEQRQVDSPARQQLQRREHELLQQRQQVQQQLLYLASSVRLSNKQICLSVCFVLLPLLRRGLHAEYLRSSRSMATTFPLQQQRLPYAQQPQDQPARGNRNREQRAGAAPDVAPDAAATAKFGRRSSSNEDEESGVGSCGSVEGVVAVGTTVVRGAGSRSGRTRRSSSRRDGGSQEQARGDAGGERPDFFFSTFLWRWWRSVRLQLRRWVWGTAAAGASVLRWLRQQQQTHFSDPVVSSYVLLLSRRVQRQLTQLIHVSLLLLRPLAYACRWLASSLLQPVFKATHVLYWSARQHPVVVLLQRQLWQPLRQLLRSMRRLSAWHLQKLLPQVFRQPARIPLQQRLLQSSRQFFGSAQQLLLLVRVALSSKEEQARAAAKQTLQVLLQRWFVQNYRTACVVHDVVCVMYMLLYLADSSRFPFWSPYNHLLQLVPLRSHPTLLQLHAAADASGAASRQSRGLLQQQQQHPPGQQRGRQEHQQGESAHRQEQQQQRHEQWQQDQQWQQQQGLGVRGGGRFACSAGTSAAGTGREAERRRWFSSSSSSVTSLFPVVGDRCQAAARDLVENLLQQMRKATRAALLVVVFTLRVLDWWNEYETAVAAAAAAGVLGTDAATLAGAAGEGVLFNTAPRDYATAPVEVPVPPPPPAPHDTNSSNEELVFLPQDKRLCPLCQQPKKNAACLPSGYTFCYRCITLHVRLHRRCPVSLLPVAENHIRRLYETEP